MGYRMTDNVPKNHAQRVFDVRNGATLKAAFACYYYKYHDRKYHDHVGWPGPRNVDNSCQEVFEPAPWIPHIAIENDSLEPIKLLEENYSNAYVLIEDDAIANNSETDAWIDPEYDNVIRVRIAVNLPTFTSKPKETGFTVIVEQDDLTRDAVCHGILKVLPGSKFTVQ